MSPDSIAARERTLGRALLPRGGLLINSSRGAGRSREQVRRMVREGRSASRRWIGPRTRDDERLRKEAG
jgi:hypothetical protein